MSGCSNLRTVRLLKGRIHMIKNNMPLGICAGFVILAFCSCFFEVPTQTITTLSICSLLFTISQALQSFLTMRDEELKTRFDANKILNNVDIDEKLELLRHTFISRRCSNSTRDTVSPSLSSLFLLSLSERELKSPLK